MNGLDTSDPKVKEAVDAIKESWEFYDTNKNGYLSKEEFRLFHQDAKNEIARVFIDVDCEDFEAVFKLYDVKGNGRIEKREMVDIIV